MEHSVQKRNDGWHVIDSEGYDVSYVTYETKREALESARIHDAELKQFVRNIVAKANS